VQSCCLGNNPPVVVIFSIDIRACRNDYGQQTVDLKETIHRPDRFLCISKVALLPEHFVFNVWLSFRDVVLLFCFWKRPPSWSVLCSISRSISFCINIRSFRRRLSIKRLTPLGAILHRHRKVFICFLWFSIPNFFVSYISFMFPTWCTGVWLSFRNVV
jgi:hypothetical protein